MCECTVTHQVLVDMAESLCRAGVGACGAEGDENGVSSYAREVRLLEVDDVRLALVSDMLVSQDWRLSEAAYPVALLVEGSSAERRPNSCTDGPLRSNLSGTASGMHAPSE